MTTYIILCSIFVLSLVKADQTGHDVQYDNKMSDREMMEILMARVSGLETDKTMQNKRIAALETDRVVQDERIAVLEDTVVKQNELIITLQTILAEKDLMVDTEAREINVHNGKAEKQVSSDRKKYLVKEGHIRLGERTKRQNPVAPVAFSSTLTNDLKHLGPHQNVVFDVTFVNTDNVYDPHHGVFTAPTSGIYVISGTILSTQGGEVWCEIAVNGAQKARIYARGTDNRHDQGSQTILLHLDQGDNVTLQNQIYDHSAYGHQYSTFSGFLLYEDPVLSVVG